MTDKNLERNVYQECNWDVSSTNDKFPKYNRNKFVEYVFGNKVKGAMYSFLYRNKWQTDYEILAKIKEYNHKYNVHPSDEYLYKLLMENHEYFEHAGFYYILHKKTDKLGRKYYQMSTLQYDPLGI